MTQNKSVQEPTQPVSHLFRYTHLCITITFSIEQIWILLLPMYPASTGLYLEDAAGTSLPLRKVLPLFLLL